MSWGREKGLGDAGAMGDSGWRSSVSAMAILLHRIMGMITLLRHSSRTHTHAHLILYVRASFKSPSHRTHLFTIPPLRAREVLFNNGPHASYTRVYRARIYWRIPITVSPIAHTYTRWNLHILKLLSTDNENIISPPQGITRGFCNHVNRLSRARARADCLRYYCTYIYIKVLSVTKSFYIL